jgi:uracil-DNA glycosylase
MPNIELTLIIGQYAQAWHLPQAGKVTLTDTVQDWRSHWPAVLPLPHPSPRNNIWLKRNGWFTQDVIPKLQARVSALLT